MLTLKENSGTALMTDFRPLRAWRYNPGKVNIQDVIAPPYDVISEAAQGKFYEASPYNCIRLILNKIRPDDSETGNRYTRALGHWNAWRQEGVLIQEAGPAFYLYVQNYRDKTSGQMKERTALFGRMKLEPFEKGIVIPHEKTLAKPREDRMKLLKATGTNFSPIFGLYEGAQRRLTPVWERQRAAAAPLYDAEDGEAVRHRVWKIDADADIRKIRDAVRQEKIYIADGHHRYTTALEYARRMKEMPGAERDEEAGSDFVLTALVAFHDPGLMLMPTHRLLQAWPGWDPDALFKKLEPHFDLRRMPLEKAAAERAQKSSSISDPAFFYYGGGSEALMISLKSPDTMREKLKTRKPDVWCRPDVNIFSELVLGALWGFSEADRQSRLFYTHSDGEALEAVKTGKAVAAFLMKTPRVEILREMGRAGELMAQKSTYFYPKLARGFVHYEHQNP